MTHPNTQYELHHRVTESDKQAFVAYYNEKSIIPVSQDIDDPEFIFKRNALYSLLGFPLATLRDRDILEFGPGGGYNATAISHYKPRNYVFVDASDASLTELQRKVDIGVFSKTTTEIVKSNIFDYNDERYFDLVIIEGVIPGQIKPREMLSHASTFVSPNGFLSITTASSVSLVSEFCRRIFLPFIISNNKFFEGQVEASERIFDSHLKALGTKTRPTRDWVLDVILHPWPKNYSFSIPAAIDTLKEKFMFYNSSPRFLIDDRFYKKITSTSETSNELAVNQYAKISSGLLDYRIPLSDIGHNRLPAIQGLCDEIERLHEQILDANNYEQIEAFFSNLNDLAMAIAPISQPTALSIQNFVTDFSKMIESNKEQEFKEFSKWWGRGQQYVSFARVSN
jgi:2-polyprenyl-3-methyl-5-hydroxy-6-metoxy-1,4-benzoquinol methylase